MSRTAKTLNNIIWGILEKTISLFLPFLIRAIIIYRIGAEYLGLNGLFSSVLQVLSLADLGFSDAIVFCMYKPISDNNRELLSALLNTFRKIYKIIGTVMLSGGICVIPFLDKIIKSDCPDDINIYLIFGIYLLNTVISYYFFGYKEAVLKAYHRNDINSRILSLCNGLMYAAQIIVLLLWDNYYWYVIIMPLATMLINIVRNYVVDKLYPDIKCTGRLEKGYYTQIVKSIIGLTLNKVAHVCRNSFDSIIISTFLGLLILARYQNYYYVISALNILMSIITSSVCGGIGNSIAVESIDKNIKNYKEFLFIYSFISCIATACMLSVLQLFIQIWVGSENLLSQSTVILCCIYFYCLKLGDVTAVYRQAAGCWWEDRYRPVAESAANLVLNIVLVHFWGVNGVLLSTIISIILINIPWATKVLFQSCFKRPAFGVFKRMFVYLCQTCVVCVIAFVLCNFLNGNIFIKIILSLLLSTAVSIIVLVLLNRKSEEYQMAKKRIAGLFLQYRNRKNI